MGLQQLPTEYGPATETTAYAPGYYGPDGEFHWEGSFVNVTAGAKGNNRTTYAAFGTVWFGALVTAALGDYPKPLVRYGGSAIIGYALSLIALPKRAGVGAGATSRSLGDTTGTLSDRHFLVGLA